MSWTFAQARGCQSRVVHFKPISNKGTRHLSCCPEQTLDVLAKLSITRWVSLSVLLEHSHLA
eukprot:168564-Hanusia_phi.AAC.1